MHLFKLKKWICSNLWNVFVQIEDMYLFKFTKCICLNWKNAFVWIEKMYLVELKKCICLNWKNVFDWIEKVEKPLIRLASATKWYRLLPIRTDLPHKLPEIDTNHISSSTTSFWQFCYLKLFKIRQCFFLPVTRDLWKYICIHIPFRCFYSIFESSATKRFLLVSGEIDQMGC